MHTLETYTRQLRLAKEEFDHIIDGGEILSTSRGFPQKLRFEVIDGSIVDVFLSSSGRYSYHWERRPIDGTLFRHDNAPHARWRTIETFPKHFHKGSEANQDCERSDISDEPEEALREFLRFVAEKLVEQPGDKE
jgi:hypothetical protein